MKNVIALLVLIGFTVIAYGGENKDPAVTLFKSGDCYAKNNYCDFVDFRGQEHMYDFGKQLTDEVDYYTGPSTGVYCENGLCTNAESEVLGLEPGWEGFTEYGENDMAKPSAAVAQSTQPTQQATEAPYYFDTDVETMNTNSGPMYRPRLHLISKANGLRVEKVTINEGNRMCANMGTWMVGKPVKTLGMGDELKTYLDGNCNIVKIDVVTNMGSWTHNIK